ncbi:MAG: SRPBCC family protein [Pricia sp.]
MSKLKSPKQLDQGLVINVPIKKAWHIFNDLSLRPKWTVDVQKINYSNQMTTVGEVAITDCIVDGKEGTLTTRCVDLNPPYPGEFIVEKETFGFSKMLMDMSFAVDFKALGKNKTRVTMQSHYRPKNFLLKLLNGFIKKKMGKEVDLMMNGLKNFMETGHVNILNPINRQKTMTL